MANTSPEPSKYEDKIKLVSLCIPVMYSRYLNKYSKYCQLNGMDLGSVATFWGKKGIISKLTQIGLSP